MTTSERMASGGQTAELARDVTGAALPAEAPFERQASERTLNESLRRMIESVRPEMVFGAPVEREGVTVIPCAEVMTGFGMGGGSGFGPAITPTTREGGATNTPASGPSGGGGIGGGGGAQGRPVAVVTISNGRVRVLPVVDATKFLIAGLTTLGFATFWVGQALARSRGSQSSRFSAARFSRAMRAARGQMF